MVRTSRLAARLFALLTPSNLKKVYINQIELSECSRRLQ
jgi:hypothetical protein